MPITTEIRESIERHLDGLEGAHGMRVLFACESGSRAYDLRTLRYDGACPECGFEILLTLCDVADRAKRDPGAESAVMSRLVDLAANTSRTLEAAMFMFCALQFAVQSEIRPSEPSVGATHVDARHLCLAVRDLARVEFGKSFAKQLAEWCFTTSEEVGDCVVEMIRYSVMQTGSEDSVEDFRASSCPDPVASNDD